jgi:hypothetical protein
MKEVDEDSCAYLPLCRVTPPALMTCSYKTQRIDGTIQRIASPSDPPLRPARSFQRSVDTFRNTVHTLDRGSVTLEACNRRWSRTSAHSPSAGGYGRERHGAPRAASNVR